MQSTYHSGWDIVRAQQMSIILPLLKLNDNNTRLYSDIVDINSASALAFLTYETLGKIPPLLMKDL